jgi:hypothetical protein
MQKNQMKCPRCQQPITVQIEQVFNVSADPEAKQRLLGRISNFASCSSCGYSGGLSTPIVYHDNSKELLLTYFPSELGLPLNEQEKIFGPLINQVVNKLPLEQRKAYLFRPQSFLTYQSLIERILNADGITPEMIKAQKARTNLIEKLLGANSEETRKAIIQQEASLIDAEFFGLFSPLMESAMASGQEKIVNQMESLQRLLLSETAYGKELQNQANEVQEAVKTLQGVGNKLTREKLLDLLLESPNDTRLGAFVSFTRPGLDYEFFQLLTKRMENKPQPEKEKLENLRTKLLELTQEIDKRMEVEQKRAIELIQILLSSQNLEQSLSQHLNEINDTFVQVLNLTMQQAAQKKDQALLEKLQQIVAILQQFSGPPPEYEFLNVLLEATDDLSLTKLLQEHDAEITPEFSQFLSDLIAQSENRTDAPANEQETKILARIQEVYRAILKFSMMKNLK